MTTIGLLFGSFNPIHIGHLALANYLLEYAPFHEIWFVVSPKNPFKQENDLAWPHHRLAMTRLAIQKEPRFKASDIEFQMPRPSYTIHTLRKLSQDYPDHQFTIIMGSDNLQTIARWSNAEEILNHYPIAVYPRPGYPMEKKPEEGMGKIRIFNPPLLDISSTLIRQSIKEGKQLRYLLPEGVHEYIIDHNLYLADN